jgi:hypothetical protein
LDAYDMAENSDLEGLYLKLGIVCTDAFGIVLSVLAIWILAHY